MQLSASDVLKVAKLARLHLSEAEVASLTAQLVQIISMIEQLDEVATEGVEPLAHALELHTVLRDDVQTPGLERNTALSNAPQRDDECFRVPPVMGSGH